MDGNTVSVIFFIENVYFKLIKPYLCSFCAQDTFSTDNKGIIASCYIKYLIDQHQHYCSH